jgi:hypothetical protein
MDAYVRIMTSHSKPKRRAVQQQLPFAKSKPLAERSPCEAENLTPEQWQVAGFAADFNQHRYCERIYKGWRDDQGQLHRCECLCHGR